MIRAITDGSCSEPSVIAFSIAKNTENGCWNFGGCFEALNDLFWGFIFFGASRRESDLDLWIFGLNFSLAFNELKNVAIRVRMQKFWRFYRTVHDLPSIFLPKPINSAWTTQTQRASEVSAPIFRFFCNRKSYHRRFGTRTVCDSSYHRRFKNRLW